jgi:predicted metal-dependent TIM-barrel fold hydrolase
MLTRIFDHHAHMDARNASDYEGMALSGVDRVLVPCSFTGEKKYSGRGYAARFDKLIGIERARAAHFGIDLLVALAVNAADIGDYEAARQGIEEVERRMAEPCVRAVGELALRSFADEEVRIFQDQLALAARYDRPVLVEACPGMHDFEQLLRILDAAFEAGLIAPGRVCMVDLNAEKLGRARTLGLGGYGLPVSPRVDGPFTVHQKLDHREVAGIVEQFGSTRIMLNSGLHFGFSDPLCLPKTVLRLRLQGMDERTLAVLVNDNAEDFFLEAARRDAQ